MTLFTALLAPERAVVVADTHVGMPDDTGAFHSGAHASKIAPLPHLHGLFVARGAVDLLTLAQSALLASGDDDLEVVALGLGAFLRQHLDEMDTSTVEALHPDHFNGLLVGWCPRRRSIAGYAYMDRTRPDRWGKRYDRGPFLGAAEHLDVERVRPLATGKPTRDAAIKLARMQFVELPADQLGFGFGGHLTLVDLDRRGMHVELRRGFFDGLRDQRGAE